MSPHNLSLIFMGMKQKIESWWTQIHQFSIFHFWTIFGMDGTQIIWLHTMVSSKLGVRINLLYCVRSIVWETFAINLGEKMAENLAENLISAYNVQL